MLMQFEFGQIAYFCPTLNERIRGVLRAFHHSRYIKIPPGGENSKFPFQNRKFFVFFVLFIPIHRETFVNSKCYKIFETKNLR